jgi:hypothetical protein
VSKLLTAWRASWDLNSERVLFHCYFGYGFAMDLMRTYIHAYTMKWKVGNGVWVKIEIVHTHDCGQRCPYSEQARNKYQHHLCSTLAIPNHYSS